MEKIKDMQDAQDILDEKIVSCPHCGRDEKWGIIRQWGECGDCQKDEQDRFQEEYDEKYKQKEE